MPGLSREARAGRAADREAAERGLGATRSR